MARLRRFTLNVIILYWACSLSACGLIELMRCAPHGEDTRFVGMLETCLNNDNDGFKADSVAHRVYCFRDDRTKPPLLLLHELPGLSGKTLEYARELSEEFTVYVPLLFGELNRQSTVSGSLAAFGLNGEWRGLERGESDIVKWLRAVVTEIERAHSGKWIGVIGNCLTGTLPLALLDNKQIHAVVLAQPTLPLTIFRNDNMVSASLGISEDEISQAKKSPAKIFYLRFEKDCVSKPEKRGMVWDIFTEKGAFPDRVRMHVIPNSKYPVPNAHSTLIGEWRVGESGKASRDAQDEVRRFLKDSLNITTNHER